MVFKSIIGVTACLVVASFNAGAALIDNGTYTTDDVSGLNWLDLSVTKGQSYNSAPALNLGWRYATNTEIENLFGILFSGFYATQSNGISDSIDAEYANQTADIAFFETLFGITGTPAGTVRSLGVYEDESGVLRQMGTYREDSGGRNVVYGTSLSYDNENLRASGNTIVGMYLVQSSVVPIPSAVWLFGSGLIGLTGLARRKS